MFHLLAREMVRDIHVLALRTCDRVVCHCDGALAVAKERDRVDGLLKADFVAQ